MAKVKKLPKDTVYATIYDNDDSYIFDGMALDEMMSFLLEIKESNPDYHDFRISSGASVDWGYDGECVEAHFQVKAWRYMTTHEIAVKKAKALKVKQSAKKSAATKKKKKEEADRKVYERLKKKFD